MWNLGEGDGNPLQYSCLRNPMDRRTWWVIVHGVAKSWHDLATEPVMSIQTMWMSVQTTLKLSLVFLSIFSTYKLGWIHKKNFRTKVKTLHAYQSLQLCLTLCDLVDYSPPGSSVHGSLQARILEWVAMPSSRGSSQPGYQICFCLLHWQVCSLPLAAKWGEPKIVWNPYTKINAYKSCVLMGP